MSSSRSSEYRHMQRRDSSSSTKRRPRLLRASATEPSLTASNASRGVLANPQSSRRATDILNRMAFAGGSSPDSLYRGSSPPAGESMLYDRMERMRADELCSSPTSTGDALDDLCARPHNSDRYFSFPSFDTWDPEGCQDGEKVVSGGTAKSTG